jgi:hypothetical protein
MLGLSPDQHGPRPGGSEATLPRRLAGDIRFGPRSCRAVHIGHRPVRPRPSSSASQSCFGAALARTLQSLLRRLTYTGLLRWCLDLGPHISTLDGTRSRALGEDQAFTVEGPLQVGAAGSMRPTRCFHRALPAGPVHQGRPRNGDHPPVHRIRRGAEGMTRGPRREGAAFNDGVAGCVLSRVRCVHQCAPRARAISQKATKTDSSAKLYR